MEKDVKIRKIDAKNKILGRLSTEIANILRGKDKANFTPNLVTGDSVIIYNARFIKFTGRKLEQKTYTTHSGYFGNIKHRFLKDVFAVSPEKVIEKAVYGMLPKNKLRKLWMKNLSIYKEDIPVKQGE